MNWKVWGSLAGTMSALFLVGCEQASQSAAAPVTVVAAKPTADPAPAPQPRNAIRLEPIGQFKHGDLDKMASEIPAYDAGSKQLIVANVDKGTFDFLDLTDPAKPCLVTTISVKPYGDKPTSVATRNGMIAMTVITVSKRTTGRVLFASPDGKVLNVLEAGHEPDMLSFTPDGKWLLVANEGEPEPDYDFDPEGTISLIDVSSGIEGLTPSHVTTLDFHAFNDRTKLDPSIRIYGKNASVSQDLEPEYITYSKDSKTAWVACQENNAVAVVDLPSRQITKLIGLGFKDHNATGKGLDASDKDNLVRVRNWPLKGMYQPDAIQAYAVEGKQFFVSANEGEARTYSGFTEEVRIAELKLDPQVFPDAKELQQKENLGQLRTTKVQGDQNGDGLHEELYSFGARSFSIWTGDGQQVFDSGDQFELITAERYPRNFNASNEKDDHDDRSDNKGPEPEGLALGEISGRMYAFIGLERMGGVMIYDISRPDQPVFDSYVNTRHFDRSNASGALNDLGPEGVLFIPAKDAPSGQPLLVLCNEISGTTRIFRIAETNPPSLANNAD